MLEELTRVQSLRDAGYSLRNRLPLRQTSFGFTVASGVCPVGHLVPDPFGFTGQRRTAFRRTPVT